MKLSALLTRLPALYYSAIEEGGPSYYIKGKIGRGKTTTFRQFPRMMKKAGVPGRFGFGLLNGANFTLQTAMGFMVPTKDEKSGHMRSVFTLPYWWTTEEGLSLDAYDGGILLIDEADKLGSDEMKIVGEAALSKVLGNHRLPPGWVVMFAGNFMNEKSGSRKEPRHLIGRRIEIRIDDDLESTIDYYHSINLLPETIKFAEENPQLVFEPMPEDERPWCTPRSLHQCDIHLQSLMRSFDTLEIPTDSLTIEEMSGGIGKPAATMFIKVIRLGQELHSYEEVVANPATITLPSKPDAQRLMSYKLAARVTEADAKAVLTFMTRMPVEHQTMFVRMTIQRHYELAFQPDFAAWCSKNTALVAVLTRFKSSDK
jgi:hypothetical protein